MMKPAHSPLQGIKPEIFWHPDAVLIDVFFLALVLRRSARREELDHHVRTFAFFPDHPTLAFTLRDIQCDEEIRPPKVLIADLRQAIVHEHVPANVHILTSFPEETERIHQELELHDVPLAFHRHPVIIGEFILGWRRDQP